MYRQLVKINPQRVIKSREVLHVCNVYYRLHTCMHFDLALFTCHHTLSTHAHAHMHTHTHTQAAPPRSTLQTGCYWTQSGWGLLQWQTGGGGGSCGLPHMSRSHAAGLPSSHTQPQPMKISPLSHTSAINETPECFTRFTSYFSQEAASYTNDKSWICTIFCQINPIPLWDE